ncbi:protein phosphatase PHLPP-like protein [Culicoides brevitarsis]|uniref:protein phosphatase PHLPP-like protein n=1 Tax=Culicoides brevitarsis TaxID=469753 RepID=UPI00307B3C08
MIKTKAKAPVVVKPTVRNVLVQPQIPPPTPQTKQNPQNPPPVKPRKPVSVKQNDEVNNNIVKKLVNGCINRTKIKIDAENSVNITSGTKMALLWNASGWIRVYLGTDRSDISLEDPNKMVHIGSESTTYDVVKDMDIPEDYTLWIQTGGSRVRRLREDEHPLRIQEEFLQKMGIIEISRRARLGIDPDFKYILRFFIGPTEPPLCGHATRSGSVELLKGLAFPQWQRRSVAIIGSKFIIFPLHPGQNPEFYDLTGAGIFEHTPNYNRLIIKIVPQTKRSHMERDQSNGMGENLDEISVYNSSESVENEEMANGQGTVLFMGFEDSWERDLWSQWLIESTVDTSTPKRMDITNSGLCAIPEVILKGIDTIEELSAGQNQLQEIALTALSNFKNLRVLHLPRNGFKKFPEPLLDCKGLQIVDLADNGIDKLPERICTLKKLEELRLDRNELSMLPNTLKDCRNLVTLELSNNRLEKLPPFMLNIKQVSGKENGKNGMVSEIKNGQDENVNPPLTRVNLRSNRLKGHIILGNYGFLTQLDVSENSIETLDLSALDSLESLQCSRNKLSELILNGRALKSLIAGNNNLKLLNISPPPMNLNHLDLSYNQLEQLPPWLSECHEIGIFFANNNQISSLPENFFHFSSDTLHTLQLGYNNLSTLPALPNRTLALRELFLQSNKIIDLPETFFVYCENLSLLNVSSNKLLTLPILDHNRCLLERVYLTNNSLTDRVLDTITYFSNLKILHAAYNRITTLPEICIANWTEIEELVLSGNRLQHLPENMANLRHLRVLRVHSNQLQSVPALAKTQTLRVLDLAHNQLDKINLVTLVPKNLQFLDLSCNVQLQVDPKELQACRSQRPMSLVDVSGKNRASLPVAPSVKNEPKDVEPPWQVGFSETPGNCAKLYISQLRLPSFCSSEGLFGLFDSDQSTVLPNIMVKCIPKILLEERTVKETAIDYMKYTMLSAHRELKQQGQKQGVCATLCHISRSKYNNNEIMSYYQNPAGGRRFILRTANVGDSEAVLVRQNGVLKLTKVTKNRKIGYSASYPIILPDPEVSEIALSDADEYLIIANRKLWEVMSAESVAEEVRKETNVILAAKRIQDIAQSYGAEENVSVLIVKFNNLGTDIDQLMRELRQTIRKKPPGTLISGFCKCGCCCESNNNCCHSGAIDPFIRQPSARSDRSSPSGQSDNTAVEGQFMKQNGKFEAATLTNNKQKQGFLTNERRSLRSGVARAVRARIEEEREREREETDSAISEEQFKCWEYMLEQNTQLLFDKELNTISKAFTKNPQSSLLRSQLKSLSASSPQLQDPTGLPNKYHTVVARSGAPNPFLSKQFGSTRSFHAAAAPQYRPGKIPSIKPPAPIPPGGPNAAYFGSIQRLMPYNLEYDFTPSIQERVMTLEDSLEEETDRMHQYWGITTTEL